MRHDTTFIMAPRRKLPNTMPLDHRRVAGGVDCTIIESQGPDPAPRPAVSDHESGRSSRQQSRFPHHRGKTHRCNILYSSWHHAHHPLCKPFKHDKTTVAATNRPGKKKCQHLRLVHNLILPYVSLAIFSLLTVSPQLTHQNGVRWVRLSAWSVVSAYPPHNLHCWQIRLRERVGNDWRTKRGNFSRAIKKEIRQAIGSQYFKPVSFLSIISEVDCDFKFANTPESSDFWMA